MVSVVDPNNLNDCDIATDTRYRWGVGRIIHNSEFTIQNSSPPDTPCGGGAPRA